MILEAAVDRFLPLEQHMNTDFCIYDRHHHLVESATHPLARLVVPHKGTPIHYGLKPVWSRMRLALYPQGVGRIRKAAEAATTPLSLFVVGLGLPPPRFALKDSDPLWAETHVESYAPDTRPNAPSGAFNYRF